MSKENPEFIAMFQLSRLVLFGLCYYTLSNNPTARFVTDANKFMKNKRDFVCGGQAQEELLPNFPTAFHFYKKWNKKHLHDLSEDEYEELKRDMEILKARYNFKIKYLDESKKPYNPYFSFYEEKNLSMQKVKV